MHAQTAHGAPGTENDVVTLSEEEAKIQKLRDRLNEVYNPIISRPDEEGEEGANDDEGGTGDEGKDDSHQIDQESLTGKDTSNKEIGNPNLAFDENDCSDTNHENNTDVDMETADDEDDVDEDDSEDVDTADSDMNDMMEESKGGVKIQSNLKPLQEMNQHQNDTRSAQAQHPGIIPQQSQSSNIHLPQSRVLQPSTNNIPSHNSPMLGSHEMIAASNSNHSSNINSQHPISQVPQHVPSHVHHQPQQQISRPSNEVQHQNSHHVIPPSNHQPHMQQPLQPHHLQQHRPQQGLSSQPQHNHHHQQQPHNVTNNSISTPMQHPQSHSSASTTSSTTGNNHILDGNVLRTPKEEGTSSLSSSMLDEFEQQMNQYQQQQNQ